MSHEQMHYDVIIVGAGPAGLSAAIHLLQLYQTINQSLRICVLDKGAEIGAHNLSGAVLNPVSLKTLLPQQWMDAPLDTPVSNDSFYYLTKKHAFKLPTPKPMKNGKDHYIISIGDLCKFLAKQAEALGCELYPGFSASELLYDNENRVIGVVTGAFGLDKQGEKKAQYQPGLALYGKQILMAEGCRGELSEQLIQRYQLRANASPQTYGLGIKEIWTIPSSAHTPGRVIHTMGWPLSHDVYGGSFIYHFSKQRIAIGLVVGLDYTNSWLSPFDEMQRFKTHPFVRHMLTGGERISYGARALNEGGFQSIPKLTFPGGMLIGDAAGFLNVAQIKGIHTAIESGLLAAKACFEHLTTEATPQQEAFSYTQHFNHSWLSKDLYRIRNIRPGFRWGLWPGLLNAAFEVYCSRGHSPWTFQHKPDHLQLKPIQHSRRIDYPKPDGTLTFDKPSSVFLSNISHHENQPCHLKLKHPEYAININYATYASPETRYCPAGVYEIHITDNHTPRLLIHAQNCIQCKTCDIKDPTQNIVWTAPEGGSGPNYTNM